MSDPTPGDTVGLSPADDGGPGLESINLPPERARLINKLAELYSERRNSDQICTTMWAFLWFCDMEKLKELVEIYREKRAPYYARIVKMLGVGEDLFASNVVNPFKGYSGCAANAPTLSESPTVRESKRPRLLLSSTETPDTAVSASLGLKQDRKLQGMAQSRDLGCVVTRSNSKTCLKVAHIFPISLSSSLNQYSTENSLWDYLKMFWSSETVNTWFEKLSNEKNEKTTEALHNMITMESSVRDAFDAGLFGLRVIGLSADKMELKVRFFWLNSPYQKSSVSISPLSTSLSITTSCEARYGGLKFWNTRTDTKVKSGDVIYLTTSDPETLPLPSPELLTLRWHINRIMAISTCAQDVDNAYE